MGRRLRTQTEWRQQYAAARCRFISTELDLAITFCTIAASTNDDRAKSERIIASAERVYAFVAKHLDGDSNPYRSSEIAEKLARLESLLADYTGQGLYCTAGGSGSSDGEESQINNPSAAQLLCLRGHLSGINARRKRTPS